MASIMTIRSKDELKDILKDLAFKQGLTRNTLVNQILWDYVKKNKGAIL